MLFIHVECVVNGRVAEVYGLEQITIDEVTDAIAEFEETLVTLLSRVDRWLLGDTQARSEDELRGYRLFKDSGCVAYLSARAQLGRQLGDEDIASIAAFLTILIGQQPCFALPILAPSNNAVPQSKTCEWAARLTQVTALVASN